MATGIKQINMVLLWNNPNPSAPFVAQTVSLDLSKYNAVVIKMEANNGSDYISKSTEGAPICFKGRAAASFTANFYDGYYYTFYRLATISDSGIEFSTGMASTGSGELTQDSLAVPLQIWGIQA